jgi:hypothetical protein
VITAILGSAPRRPRGDIGDVNGDVSGVVFVSFWLLSVECVDVDGVLLVFGGNGAWLRLRIAFELALPGVK